MMFCSSCCSSSNCSGGILLWNSGSILSWLSFTSVLLSGHFRFTDNGLNVVVKPISCLAIRADILDELPGVGSAEMDALCVQKCPSADGAPFVDLAHLRRSNLDKGVLTYCRHKTGQEVSISVPREAMEIINRRMVENCHPSYLLPILGQPRTRKRHTKKALTPYQEYQYALRNLNRRLERVSVDLRLGGRLSSYTARHTWATIAFHQETPVGVISRGLGHSSVKVTETYLKPFGDREVDRTNRKILNYVLNAV